MTGNGGLTNVPPFSPEYRASGLLLHITSLPSPLWRRRSGIISPRVDQCSPPYRPGMVAVTPARSDWLRKLTLSTNVVVCRIPAWRSTACICRPKRSTFACMGSQRRSCVTQPCACIAEEWGTIAALTRARRCWASAPLVAAPTPPA
jgi:hypothetical protein